MNTTETERNRTATHSVLRATSARMRRRTRSDRRDDFIASFICSLLLFTVPALVITASSGLFAGFFMFAVNLLFTVTLYPFLYHLASTFIKRNW